MMNAVRRHLVLLLCLLPLVILYATLRAQVQFRLDLVDLTGRATTLGLMPPGTFAPRVSPDGRQVAFDADRSIWIADLKDLAKPRRLADGLFPMWSADGARVLFIVGEENAQQLFWQAADGSGKPELLIDSARAPESWSASAQVLTYITRAGDANYDVWSYSLRDRTSSPLVATADPMEMGSRLSPDGRWLAYESGASGTRDIYVEPFPKTGARTKVTTGRRPMWSPDGKEIFFDRDDSQLYVVSIQLSPTLTVGTPTALPIKGFLQGGARRMYDITPDGKQFVMLFR
jgi:Tol biopolymer transport system component